MAKIPTLSDISNVLTSALTLNANWDAIQTAFNNTLSRDGSTPNQMEADLDLNDNGLLNAASVSTKRLFVNGERTVSTSTLPNWKGVWATSTAYAVNDLVRENNNTYICLEAHTSGTFSTDLTNENWELFVPQGASGSGSGDLLATNNLSDVVDLEAARSNLSAQPFATILNTISSDISGMTGVDSSLVSGTAGVEDTLAIWNSDGDLYEGPSLSTIFGLPGQLAMFAMSTVPTGWLKANGAAISRTAYSELFDALGTTYGTGDGSTTFNLPDLRGEFLRSWDDGRGVDASRTFGSFQNYEVQSHTHGFGFSAVGRGQGSDGNYVSPNSVGLSTMATGGNETRPRNIAMLICIKY